MSFSAAAAAPDSTAAARHRAELERVLFGPWPTANERDELDAPLEAAEIEEPLEAAASELPARPRAPDPSGPAAGAWDIAFNRARPPLAAPAAGPRPGRGSAARSATD